MAYKCECGKDLIDYSGEGESSSQFIDTVHNSFICEDGDCGKRYSIEFHSICESKCECGCELELDDDNTDGNIASDCVNLPAICHDCGNEENIEYHPISINREDDN
ncbi:hypothetical protein [Vibrio sp. D431a]|uniref:hypothetical protein n=1 Tax=Vibrio sp. D431a TaxID=2837388 RepID=UPI00255553BF|nr:hypothetical protein [Vibrio sp. D431a]MDK9793716.1 hypothetical protein [Vibrio sp. D431a]